MSDQNPNIREAASTPVVTWIGFILWAAALLWWFAYYAQWEGAFGLMRLKIMCIVGASHECMFFQEQINKTSWIPTYSPILWWGGCLAFFVGRMQRRAMNRAG